jgi:hypothetical protein
VRLVQEELGQGQADCAFRRYQGKRGGGGSKGRCRRVVVAKQAARRVEAPDSRLVWTPHVVGSALNTLVGRANDHDEHIVASGQCRTFTAGEQYSLFVDASTTMGVVSHQKSWPIDKNQDVAHDDGDGGVSV